MERITKADLTRALGWLCDAAGRSVGTGEGEWSLENWNGWLLVEGVGESHPFGSKRRSSREMYDVMQFAQQAFSLAKVKQ